MGLRGYVATELDKVPSSPRPELGPKAPRASLRKPAFRTGHYYTSNWVKREDGPVVWMCKLWYSISDYDHP